jgi:hypothetical protein
MNPRADYMKEKARERRERVDFEILQLLETVVWKEFQMRAKADQKLAARAIGRAKRAIKKGVI